MLSLGDKFSLPINSTQKTDRMNSTLGIIKNFEVKAYRLSDEVLNATRNAIANLLQKFLDKRHHTNYIDRHINSAFNYCKKFFRNNDDLMVTRADKGQVTVILNRSDYYDKMSLLLEDTTAYKKLNKDLTKRITNKINAMVKV
ncbi:hypothetical protein X777_10505 [Ooceraea biroi]|uniref:Uncharacterized protein n=1 Tax=Ooceraea biroi TaxID=2015173 RepID=A0A026X0T0_OOCBI|nr:hypothetical protein X777_10505 [Ooceraea biroi]